MVSFRLLIADENADNRSESLNRRVILSTNARIEFISRNGESAVVENRIASLSEYSIAELLKYFEVGEDIAQVSIVDDSNISRIINRASEVNGTANEPNTEPLEFDVQCPGCGSDDCKTRMCFVNIPFFEELILMTTVCDNCGFRDSEVKRGGGIQTQGVRYKLIVRSLSDFNREILKSEHSRMMIPSIELTIEPGTLGGRLSTIEGFLSAIKDSLSTTPMASEPSTRDGMQRFLENLDKCIRGESFPFEIILDDPSGFSKIQNFYAPESDPDLIEEYYDRTEEQIDELGLGEIH
ncbi:hypothetical protein GJ496_001451 [Pomphorhynchus laevis]|nr:hypothetical protein GJ496_001451 [Pomphorhynchus laevis]